MLRAPGGWRGTSSSHRWQRHCQWWEHGGGKWRTAAGSRSTVSSGRGGSGKLQQQPAVITDRPQMLLAVLVTRGCVASGDCLQAPLTMSAGGAPPRSGTAHATVCIPYMSPMGMGEIWEGKTICNCSMGLACNTSSQ